MTTAVKVEGISKVYQIGKRAKTLIDDAGSLLGDTKAQSSQQFYALKDISFEIERGEVVGIVGRNGAGKSTLLKILSRITEPTTGSFEIVGRLGSLLEVGVGFHPNLSGRDNIYLSGAVHGLKHREIQARFADIVAFSELEEFLDVPVRCYSTGMAVRLGFAVAIHMRQQIIIIDEALAVGDTAFQRKCWQKLNELAKSGITVIFVSHNTSLMSSCNRTVYLEHGQIKSIGPSDVVVATYMADLVGQESERMERSRALSHLFGNYGDQISLTGIELIAGKDNLLKAGTAIEYRLRIEPKQTLSGLRLFARLYNDNGSCVASAFSQELFSAAEGQSLRAVFTLEGVNLMPGRYSVKLTISKADNPNEELERIIIRPSFTIEATEATPDHIDWQPDWGSIIVPSTFKLLS